MTSLSSNQQQQLQTWLQQGLEAYYRQSYDEAKYFYQNILDILPHHGKTLHFLAHTYAKEKNMKKSLAYGLKAKRHGYKDFQLIIDIGYWYLRLDQYEKSLEILSKYADQEEHPKLHEYLCLLYRKLNHAEKSIEHGSRANHACFNKFKIYFNNFCIFWSKSLTSSYLWRCKKNLYQSLECLKKSQAWLKSLKHQRFNMGYSYLIKSDLSQGWLENESKDPDRYRKTLRKYTYWRGENLTNRSILILPEQGLGEELLFSHTFADLIRDCHRVTICCDPRLVHLYQRSFPTVDLHAVTRDQEPWIDQEMNFDYICFSGTLLYHYRRNFSDFSKSRGWLTLDPKKTHYWQQYFSKFDKSLNVGIAWRSLKNRDIVNHQDYYFSLEDLIPILGIPDIHFFNLQYGDADDDINHFIDQYNIKIHTIPDLDLFHDIENTAHALSALDLSITPFISTHCLAGAIGAENWVIQSNPKEFNFCGQEKSPFFPHLKLFRNTTMRNWKPIMLKVQSELQSLRKDL